jgi:hypothetical protein
MIRNMDDKERMRTAVVAARGYLRKSLKPDITHISEHRNPNPTYMVQITRSTQRTYDETGPIN